MIPFCQQIISIGALKCNLSSLSWMPASTVAHPLFSPYSIRSAQAYLYCHSLAIRSPFVAAGQAAIATFAAADDYGYFIVINIMARNVNPWVNSIHRSNAMLCRAVYWKHFLCNLLASAQKLQHHRLITHEMRSDCLYSYQLEIICYCMPMANKPKSTLKTSAHVGAHFRFLLPISSFICAVHIA